MPTRAGLALLLLIAVGAWPTGPARAQAVDLAPFARVTATNTFDSFLMLWPRETDDAAYTIRDGAAETAWKTPFAGKLSLQLDFAPLLAPVPALAALEPQWATAPQGAVRVIASAFCGGPQLFEARWDDPTAPFAFEPPISTRCLRLDLADPGHAVLTELRVYAADQGEAPALSDAELTAGKKDLIAAWTANEDAAFVRVDYLDDAGEAISDETLIEIVSARSEWRGPWPLATGARVALTPLSAAGAAGETRLLTPPPGGSTPAHPLLGTIEGFYGTLWSDGERRRMMLMLARFGFGSYLYQPKWDLLNREEWRTPYGDEQVAAFAALRRFGERIGVTMIFGLGPAFDMIVDDPGERAILLDKLAPLVDAGFRDFELGFDDIEFSVTDPVDGAMGAKHVDLVNWTQEQLGALAGEPVNLWMMPTPYSTEREFVDFPQGADYLDQLADLRAGVHVMWNGPDTFAREISAADLEDITARAGRKPVIWENMHCNDAGDGFIGKLYLAPIMNRAADMPAAVEGFMTNPLIMGAANRLVYGSYADFFDDPAGYRPQQAMPGSLSMEVSGEADQALAADLSDNYWGLGILGPPGSSITRNRPMEAAMDDLRAVVEGADLAPIIAAGGRLLAVGAQMASAQNDLHHSGFRADLVDDLWYPAERLVDEGRAILLLMAWLGKSLAGVDDAAAMEEVGRQVLDSLLHDRYETSLLRLFVFRRHLERAAIASLGFEAPAIAAPTALSAVVGELWTYDSGLAEGVAVHGLRGAETAGGLVSWRPSHAGVYQVVVTAQSPNGWASREFVVTAGDPPADDDDDDDNDDAADDDDDSGRDGDDDEHGGDDRGCGC